MRVHTTVSTLVGDRPARRRVLLVTPGSWLVFSLAAGGGLVQYAPDGWIVPIRTWITYAQPTPYALYALTEHWAVVPVPLYLAQALGVALLAGLYAGVAFLVRRCRVGARPRRRVLGLTGTLTGVLGAAACCSPLAIVLGMLLGGSLAATLTGIGLWAAAGLFTVGIAIEARRLSRIEDATRTRQSPVEAPVGSRQTTWPAGSTATAPRPAHTGQERDVVSSSRS